MKRMSGFWSLALGLCACDARVDPNYRGESLVQVRGALRLNEGVVPSASVPALAFEGEPGFHLLDVDTTGEFPASFTIDVMSPPPPEVIHTVPGLADFAYGYVTAVPVDHPATIEVPLGKVDGPGGWTVCYEPDDCWYQVDQCLAGTDECYHELSRCRSVPVEDAPVEGATKLVCDDIVEQSGNPLIADRWAGFMGLSENYFLVYVDSDEPPGSARDYMLQPELGPHMLLPAAFGDRPITPGYHLFGVRELTEAEATDLSPCVESVEAEVNAQFNQAHGTEYEGWDQLANELRDNDESPDDDPDLQGWQRDLSLALFDAGCLQQKHYEHVDPNETAIEVVLGHGFHVGI